MMRRFTQIIGLVVAASCVVGCRTGEKKLERVDVYTQYHGVTFVEKFKVWATGPDELINKDAFFEPENYIYEDFIESATKLCALLKSNKEEPHNLF